MFEITVEIARPVRDVFARLVDVEAAPKWYSAVQQVTRLDDGPVGAGARYRFTRELGGKSAVNEVAVSHFEDGRAITLSSVSGPTPFVYAYELKPTAGGTLLTLHGTISGEGLGGPMALFKSMAEPFFRRGMIENLKAFKELTERG